MDEKNSNVHIWKDLREQLYPLMGERITKMLNSFEEKNWLICFQSCNSVKMLIHSHMNDGEKQYYEKLNADLRELIYFSFSKGSDEGEIKKRSEAAAKLPIFLEKYIQLLFVEMNNQGIWFPKSKKHETFNDMILEETFGMPPEESESKVDILKKIPIDELLKLLPRQEIEKLYVKMEIKNVLSK